MGRYSPTVVADYGRFNPGAPLDALAEVLMSIRERKRQEREDKARQEREGRLDRRARQESLARMAGTGIFEGPTPENPTRNIPLALPGGITPLPVATNRYRDLGEGLYQDFEGSPEGRAIAGDERREARDLARERERNEANAALAGTKSREAAIAEEARRRRVAEMAKLLGFSEGEQGVFAESGNADALAGVIAARDKAKHERPKTPKADPRIAAEDERRKALAGNLKTRIANYQSALVGDEQMDAPVRGKMGKLEQRSDSLAVSLGSLPGDDAAYRRIFGEGGGGPRGGGSAVPLDPAVAAEIQSALDEINSLAAQARKEGQSPAEVEALVRQARAALFKRYQPAPGGKP